MERTPRLLALYQEVHARCESLAQEHPAWPCARGCGACCRTLARVPELTRSEWELVAAALHELPQSERDACMTEARALAATRRPDTDQRCQCPLFDAQSETCRVYAARPLACRTYGFYTGRAHDAWCGLVADHVAQLDAPALLGNLDASEAALTRIGSCGPLPPDERRDLLDWLGL